MHIAPQKSIFLMVTQRNRHESVFDRLYRQAAEKRVPNRQTEETPTKQCTNKRWEMWYDKCVQTDRARKSHLESVKVNETAAKAAEALLECTFRPGAQFDHRTAQKARVAFRRVGRRQAELLELLKRHDQTEKDFVEELSRADCLQRTTRAVLEKSDYDYVDPTNQDFLLVAVMRALEQQATQRNTDLFQQRMAVLKELTGLQVQVRHIMHQTGAGAEVTEGECALDLVERVREQKWHSSAYQTCLAAFRDARVAIKDSVEDMLKNYEHEYSDEEGMDSGKEGTAPSSAEVVSATPPACSRSPAALPRLMSLEQAFAYHRAVMQRACPNGRRDG